MIWSRAFRAVLYVLAAAAILIGRDIWRSRRTWDDLERRYAERGLDIHDHL